ncbi:hypothetical protein CASFOL_013993 [Castilleja foliolosa]|uniref:Uncharacterized protein n=1 Tax=Castilleja foliolosa TaxID=1961234 RepID=A0ABD3DLL8_9LAMI
MLNNFSGSPSPRRRWLSMKKGKHKLGASRSDLNIEIKGSEEVELGFDNGVVDDIFFASGYDIRGHVVAQYIESGVVVLLLCLAQELYMRAERVALLQNFLKQCDEANQREYSKRFLHLSPLDLSKHAECDEATYDEIGV